MIYKHYSTSFGANILIHPSDRFSPIIAEHWQFCCQVEGQDRDEVMNKYKHHLMEMMEQQRLDREEVGYAPD